MSKNPTSKVKRANFDQYNIEDLREKEYNDLLSSIKDAVETFKSDVQK